ncbi:hypothetical protein TIFTF001_004898 [Ficus carica]|uniref:Uncharacterized protein n=1 Tax=Ficus carica TaxID=3494 RepID=A0AA87ZJ10_FICCA|nr:hypothetical protein TIFTF001_004898 [Ficus carica]
MTPRKTVPRATPIAILTLYGLRLLNEGDLEMNKCEWGLKCRVPRSGMYFRFSIAGDVARSYNVLRGYPLLAEVGMKGIEVIAHLGTPILEVLRRQSCRRKLWYASVNRVI